MFKVKNGIIYHTRGDTASLSIHLTDSDGKEITDYTAKLSVKKRFNDESYLFQVDVENGFANITHEITQGLPYGDYVYDIEVHTSDGQVQTIGPNEYHLLPDVTT